MFLHKVHGTAGVPFEIGGCAWRKHCSSNGVCCRELNSSPRSAFTGHDFEVLVDEAIRVILGQTAPSYTFGYFDENNLKGSLIVQASDVHLIWAALSIYGRHFGKPVALHFSSVSFFFNLKG